MNLTENQIQPEQQTVTSLKTGLHLQAKQVGQNIIQKQNENIYQNISLVTTDYLHFGYSFY